MNETGSNNNATFQYVDSVDRKLTELVALNISVEGFLPDCSICANNKSDINESYLLYNLAVIGVVLPVVAVFGVCGNAISAFVYSRKAMRTSLNLFLCALGLSDICVILTAVFLFFVEGLRRHSPEIAISYARGAPYLFPLGTAAQTCSVYFTVAAATECFISVVLPRRFSRRWCTPGRAVRIMPVIFVLCVGFNICHFFDIQVIECWDSAFHTPSLQVCPSEFRMDMTYHTIYYVYLYTIVMAMGPLAVLIVLNGAIVVSLMTAKRKRSRSRSVQSEMGTEEEEESGDTVTLILVVFLFILCNSLALIINFLENSIPDDKKVIMNYLVDLSNIMVVCNSSANFIIYYAFGESFRRTLRSYICGSQSKARGQISAKSNGNPALNSELAGPLLPDAPLDGSKTFSTKWDNYSCVADVLEAQL